MKIGQPFYKVNENYILSAFEDHKFDVLYILGIESDPNGNVLIEATSAIATVSESLIIDRSTDDNLLLLEYNIDDFLKLTDEEQNLQLLSQHGYVANPEYLRSEFNSKLEIEIENERIKIQQRTDYIDEIENSIQPPADVFNSMVTNWAPIFLGATIMFKSNYYGNDVTGEVIYMVNGETLPAGTTSFEATETNVYNVVATYLTYSVNYSFEVLPNP